MYQDEEDKKKEFLSWQLIMKWTNQKAEYAGAGEGGSGYYPTFKRFTMKEIRQHTGLYVWNELNPSPRVEYKFDPQVKNKLHGSDFIYDSFGGKGSNVKTRHKQFKVRFAN